jgi:hypothetical protein
MTTHIRDVANLFGNRYPGKLGYVISRVYATNEELGPGRCKLETEHGRAQYILGDKILNCRWCVIVRYGLETHAHQAVGRELAGLKPCRIL